MPNAPNVKTELHQEILDFLDQARATVGAATATIDRMGVFYLLDDGKVKALPASRLADIYVELRGLVDDVEALLQPVSDIRNKYKDIVVPEAFERENISTFTSKSGFRVTVSIAVRASVSDKEQGYEWLRNNGLAELIVETVNASTLASAAKHMLEEGRELPEDYFRVHLQPSTSITKVKKK